MKDAGEVSMDDVATMLIARGNRREAIALVESALDEDFDCATARLLARIRIESGVPGDALEAMSCLRACVLSDPRDFEALQLLREAALVAGRACDGKELARELRCFESRARWLVRCAMATRAEGN